MKHLLFSFFFLFVTHFSFAQKKEVLTVYVPEKPNGLAVIACPGGSYLQVWQGSEGHNLAEWYNEQGITYAVLKYRLPNGHKEVPLDDVHKALSIMKSHQKEYGFTQIGIQGCSAGVLSERMHLMLMCFFIAMRNKSRRTLHRLSLWQVQMTDLCLFATA